VSVRSSSGEVSCYFRTFLTTIETFQKILTKIPKMKSTWWSCFFEAEGTSGRPDGHDEAKSCYSLCDAYEKESESRKEE
jgi:hypothetical protein